MLVTLPVNSTSSVNEVKLRGILEYFLLHGSKRNGVPKTKLLKLVYLADFSSYYLTGKSLTGATYKNRTYGPVSDTLFALIDEMKESGDISVEQGSVAQFHLLNVEPLNLKTLSKEEMALLEKISEYWKNKSTEQIVDFTHNQRPWALTRADAEIPYELILQEDHPFLPNFE